MKLTKDQQEKVNADEWFGSPYEHIKVYEPLSETTGDDTAVEGRPYTRLASPFQTVVAAEKPFTFEATGLNVGSGDLKVVFFNAGLRAVSASICGLKGKATKLTVSAFDKAGNPLATVTEALNDGVTSILFENLPSDIHELRFSGGAFVFLNARAINRVSTTPVQTW
ncbi:hypothetical protein BJI69_09435 [Luteibacter rhizovicinus DSM 16549]|uniref:Uncharacterized protein n=1 Tax=Luteibacter rhizovicinus DSM 16549 TaxID=1440763 RepID=A0A0G9HBE4_9GAMM|nr:hypothetical protein [Luteibacter rhizovicinus]APG04095.1 hypothetical protein BJI69_09435 [Luteibacter rhizovicinus DSM 16549]KLD66761.1 hypothetical protein Y883_11600 [Luteibacter rhizovicinus DSM 16549]